MLNSRPHSERHVLTDCAHLIRIHECYYQAERLNALFDSVSVPKIVAFLQKLTYLTKYNYLRSYVLYNMPGKLPD